MVLIKAGLSEHNPVVKNCSAASGSGVEPLELVPSIFDGWVGKFVRNLGIDPR